MNEIELSNPETVTLPNPIRSARTVIDGRPQITRYTIEGRARNHFVVTLHDEGRTIRVPRATPTTNAREAVRAYITGGAE